MFLSYSLVSVGCVVRNTRYQNKDNRKFNRQKRNLLKKSCHAELQVHAHTPQLHGRLFSLTDTWKNYPTQFYCTISPNTRWYVFCAVDIPNEKCAIKLELQVHAHTQQQCPTHENCRSPWKKFWFLIEFHLLSSILLREVHKSLKQSPNFFWRY